MSDDIDAVQTRDEGLIDAAVYVIRKQIRPIELSPGECNVCGEHVGRLINGACCPCIDRRHKLYAS